MNETMHVNVLNLKERLMNGNRECLLDFTEVDCFKKHFNTSPSKPNQNRSCSRLSRALRAASLLCCVTNRRL